MSTPVKVPGAVTDGRTGSPIGDHPNPAHEQAQRPQQTWHVEIGAMPGDWAQSALCAQVDPELFFPGKSHNGNAAKKICGMCDVRIECLQFAIETDQRGGIWGGMTEHTRAILKRKGNAA